MKRTQQYEHNTAKKRKLENQIRIVNNNKSHLEDLANEIIYEIFDYLDSYDAYKGFYHLNKRFENLFKNSNLSKKIHISTMSKWNFLDCYLSIILPNRRRISLLHLSHSFCFDTIFSPPRNIAQFVCLETLILDNIESKHLDKICNYLLVLPNFHSLTVSLADYIDSLCILFLNILHLPTLKYCKITYRTKLNETPSSPYLGEFQCSPIEYLIINGRFPFGSLNNLLSCLPRLHHLSIDSLVNSRYSGIEEKLPLIKLKYLKYVSLKLNNLIYFDNFEKIIKKFFHYVQTLRLTTLYDEEYLNARRWETLISSSMPYLRIFDINHNGSVHNGTTTYHDLINQFNSSFWSKRQWFFTHQHDWRENLEGGIFYSTNRYRRQDYIFYWEFENQTCSHIQETNLNSVKHLHICSKKATNKCVNYFPNVTQLTIKHLFETFDDSISTTLNRLIPLKQLTKLIIDQFHFPFLELVKLLCFTPNLKALKLDLLYLDEDHIKLIEQSKPFQYISYTNQIKNLDVRVGCSLKHIQIFANLFPKLEYLKAGMNRKEIGNIIQLLLTKSNHKLEHLFFLCISETPKICLKEINVLIQSENLLNDYFIKFINRDLYIWWENVVV